MQPGSRPADVLALGLGATAPDGACSLALVCRKKVNNHNLRPRPERNDRYLLLSVTSPQ
jgi:hypothetical protein